MAELIEIHDPRWTGALARVQHDVYHLPSYVEFAARHQSGSAVALYAESGDAILLAPIVRRSLPDQLGEHGFYDAVSPYGYASPLLHAADGAEAERLLASAFDVAARERIVSLFFRLHPLLPAMPEALTRFGTLVSQGETVYLNIDPTATQVWSGIRSGHMSDIKRLRRDHFVVEFDDWGQLDAFADMYRATMERVSADEFYFFDARYFRGMRSALGDALHLCTVSAPDGTLAAGGLFSERSGLVQYLFSGTATEFVRRAPSKLMLYEVIRWCMESGFDRLHLGGGVGAREDALFRFKAGFSDCRADFSTYRVVADEERYLRLVQRWSAVTGLQPPRADGYFPAYRLRL